MTTYRHIATLLYAAAATTAAVLLAACSSDEAAVADPRTDGGETVALSVGVSTVPTSKTEIVNGGTRAATSAELLTMPGAAHAPYSFRGTETVAVSVDMGHGISDTKVYLAAAGHEPKLTMMPLLNLRKQNDTDAGTYDISKGHQWRQEHETLTLAAWSTATAETTPDNPDGQPFTLNADQRSDGMQRELLYHHWDDHMRSAAPALRLPLYHQCARIAVRVDAADSELKGCTVHMPLTATWHAPQLSDATYGSWTAHGAATDIHARDYTSRVGRPQADSPKMYAAVVMPQAIPPHTPLFTLFMADGTTYTYYTPGIIDLTAGRQLTCIVNLTGSQYATTMQMAIWAEASASADAGHPQDIRVPAPGGDASAYLTLAMHCVDAGSTPANAHPATADERYYISRTEVTRELWHHVMGTTPTQGQHLPAAAATLSEARAFVDRLNQLTAQTRPQGWSFQLPTAEQWRFAALGGCHSQGYTYSGANILERVAVCGTTAPDTVAGRQPNELGLYDMSGNAAEWTLSGLLAGGCCADTDRSAFQPADTDRVMHQPDRVPESLRGLRLVMVSGAKTSEE